MHYYRDDCQLKSHRLSSTISGKTVIAESVLDYYARRALSNA